MSWCALGIDLFFINVKWVSLFYHISLVSIRASRSFWVSKACFGQTDNIKLHEEKHSKS